MIDDVIELVQITLPKMVKIKWEKPIQKIIISANYTQVFQIIMNLCLNASKAMCGSGNLSVALFEEEISETNYFLGNEVNPGRFACIVVSDTGSGLDEERMRNLTENPISVQPSESGTGLGLSIVARMLMNHSGFFKINSIQTKGTAFKLFFPKRR
ncbi:MAG TPA: hypothetical protein EYP36_04235 [Calditrichaeota bacterium]|nr:hypothetical protein [Calditrichota bacterium]